jgi:hypothetical protein
MTPERNGVPVRLRVIEWLVVAAACALLLVVFYLVTDTWLARVLLAVVTVPAVVWLQTHHRRQTS